MKNSTRIVILVVIVIVIFAGAHYYLRESQSQEVSQVTPQENIATTTEVASVKEFTLVVKNRKLVEGSDTLSVTQGDSVAIHITVDEAEELHLHGYNVHIDLDKDKEGTLTLVASSSGRFPFELEHSSTELGALEVQPK